MSYFQDVSVTHGDRTYYFSAAEGRALESGAYGWLARGDPSSGLAVDALNAARLKVVDAPETVALELAARALGITVERLASIIEWRDKYLRWHDGLP